MKASNLFVPIAVLAWLVASASPALAQSNLAAAGAGGKLVFFSSQYSDSDWAAANLIDGSSTTSWSGRSGGPQAVILAFRDGGLVELDDVVVNPYSREGNNNWVRTAEVHVSTTYPVRDFRKVGTLELAPEGTDQVLSFERPVPARYLKVVFLDNGGGGYMQAGEIRAIGRAVTDGGPAPAYHAYHESATLLERVQRLLLGGGEPARSGHGEWRVGGEERRAPGGGRGARRRLRRHRRGGEQLRAGGADELGDPHRDFHLAVVAVP
jgi:hypothetical protein